MRVECFAWEHNVGSPARALALQGPVRNMVSANHWLSGIKINGLSCYLTLVSANQASSNSAQVPRSTH